MPETETTTEKMCACCGAVILPSKDEPRVSRIAMAKEGEKPLIREFHKRCDEFARNTWDEAWRQAKEGDFFAKTHNLRLKTVGFPLQADGFPADLAIGKVDDKSTLVFYDRRPESPLETPHPRV